jgi:NtrC-family two-component system sensor histidine kinase KinB
MEFDFKFSYFDRGKKRIKMKSLSTKIGLGYFIIICINVAIAVFAIYHINRLGSPINRILKEKYQNVSAAESMVQSLRQQEIIQEALVEDGFDSTLVINFNTYKNEFYNWHQRAIEGIALPSEPVILDSLMSLFRIYLNKSDTLLALSQQSSKKAIRKNYEKSVVAPLRNSLIELSLGLKKVNETAITEADQKARHFSNQATLVIIVISMLAVLLSIFAGVRFTRNILKPVKKTTETVRKIGQGHLNQKVEITTDDEIAELGLEFNKMTERLQEYERMNISQIIHEKKKSEAIVAGIPVSIIVTDEYEKLTLLNDRAKDVLDIHDYSWQGKPIVEVIEDRELVKLLSPGSKKTEKSGDSGKTLFSLRKGNEERFFFLRRIEIRDDDQKLSGVVTLLQDVTSFKNLDRLKSEFMATISHEFKTPLTSINMSVDILLREAKGKLNTVQRDLLVDTKKDCQRLRDLVKDLLDLSKLESGKQQMHYEKLDFSDLLESALHPLRFAITAKKIKLEKHLEGHPGKFEADCHYILQVLTNLLENAIQHTPEIGTVTITAGTDQNNLKVCIGDSGPGIPEEAIDLIFDKFVQVKNFQNAERGNIGMGLAISREIIKAHSGQIWAESEPGRGSKFYFTIPVEQPQKAIQTTET